VILIVSQALLWGVVILLAFAVLALARQVGVLHERIAPVGALALGQGPQPGEAAPKLAAATLDGREIRIGGANMAAKSTMLFFVAPSCPICKKLIPTALRFADVEGVDLLFVGDGDQGQHRSMAERHGIAFDRFVNSSEVGQAYRVGKLPYAVLIDPRGTIVSQGLVNTREHLESLLVAGESGFDTIQDYLHAKRHVAAPDTVGTPTHG